MSILNTRWRTVTSVIRRYNYDYSDWNVDYCFYDGNLCLCFIKSLFPLPEVLYFLSFFYHVICGRDGSFLLSDDED
ncbi:TPA: hypothetical protein NOA82_003060, partial [Enterococcus faecium]|nr:hypothetical protein [Enterococcus faecium]